MSAIVKKKNKNRSQVASNFESFSIYQDFKLLKYPEFYLDNFRYLRVFNPLKK